MPALENTILRTRLAGALPQSARFLSDADEVHPARVEIPQFGTVQIYLWTVTPDKSVKGRPAGEHKIQLILPGQARGGRGSLVADRASTALLGYSPEFGVLVGWEASHYNDFAYSRNVQCREELLAEARSTGWAVAAPRKIEAGDEVRVAFSSGNLMHFLRLSREADQKNLNGVEREAFFLGNTPNSKATLPVARHALADFVEKQRQRVASTRLSRDRTFSSKVKIEYNFACALCDVQLEIVEGAHILPVREEGSSDEVWNGIALCPNHHQLFDGNTFVIAADLTVYVDEDRVTYFKENGIATGIETVTDFVGEKIRAPRFWSSSADLKARMKSALDRRVASVGFV